MNSLLYSDVGTLWLQGINNLEIYDYASMGDENNENSQWTFD